MTQGFKVPLTLFVPCKNEETNLARCLQSVRWIDEIFVVDSQSTGRTTSIADEHGAKVMLFEYKVGLPKKKNWAENTFLKSFLSPPIIQTSSYNCVFQLGIKTERLLSVLLFMLTKDYPTMTLNMYLSDPNPKKKNWMLIC